MHVRYRLLLVAKIVDLGVDVQKCSRMLRVSPGSFSYVDATFVRLFGKIDVYNRAQRPGT